MPSIPVFVVGAIEQPVVPLVATLDLCGKVLKASRRTLNFSPESIGRLQSRLDR